MTEFIPENSDRSIKLRQYRDALAISGGVVIAFSLWDMLKVLIGLFLGEETITEIVSSSIRDGNVPDSENGAKIRMMVWLIIIGVMILICTLIFLYHLYIGLNAYREGREKTKKKRVVYLVFTVVSSVLSAVVLGISIAVLFQGEESGSQVGYATLLLEISSLLNYIYLLYSAVKIRKLERKTV
ncbi:MAG: hypothetical protein J6N53_15510 [Lachnospiraceae bacterium]|nr:hypothetical protein [Lachnospiraceae bacterium]